MNIAQLKRKLYAATSRNLDQDVKDGDVEESYESDIRKTMGKILAAITIRELFLIAKQDAWELSSFLCLLGRYDIASNSAIFILEHPDKDWCIEDFLDWA